MKVNFLTPDGIASWDIIRELYQCEKNAGTKLCPKLTLRHVKPNTFEKMRVKLATQVFSRSEVAGIRTMADFEKFSRNVTELALSTARFIEKMDRLFDNLNSKLLHDKSVHKSVLICIGLVHKNLNEMMVYLNQDPLENCFFQIRQRGGNNRNPSVLEFTRTTRRITTLLILENFSVTNCEEDGNEQLITGFVTLDDKTEEHESTAEFLEDDEGLNEITDDLDNAIIKTDVFSQMALFEDSSV